MWHLTNNLNKQAKSAPAADGDHIPQRTIESASNGAGRLREEFAQAGLSHIFSDHAIATLSDHQSEYTREVCSEAIRSAKRNRSDLVSAADIEAADKKLRGPSLRGQRALANTVGAGIFGAGAGEFITVMTTTHPNHLGIGLAGGGMAVGLTCVACALARGR
jgi:histone H3/H4